MINENRPKSKRDLAMKITIPIAVILVLVGIWIFKNALPGEPVISSGNTSGIQNNNPDFELPVTEKINLEKLKSYGLPILIDFGADSCIPCKEMAPVLKKLNEELRGKAIIRFVDVWKYQSLSDGYPISVIPTQVLYDSAGNPYTPKGSNGNLFKMYSLKEDTNKHVFTAHEGGMTETMIRAALVEMGMKE